MMGALCFKQQSTPYRKMSDLKSKENIEMRKLNDNFYSITRRGKRWSKKQIKLLEKYVNYKMFLPIPRDFVREAIFGTQDPDEKEYYNSPPKFILLNFDSKNGKRQSLRGLASVSTDGCLRIQILYFRNYRQYFTARKTLFRCKRKTRC